MKPEEDGDRRGVSAVQKQKMPLGRFLFFFSSRKEGAVEEGRGGGTEIRSEGRGRFPVILLYFFPIHGQNCVTDLCVCERRQWQIFRQRVSLKKIIVWMRKIHIIYLYIHHDLCKPYVFAVWCV